MDNPVILKALVAVLLVLWVMNIFRKMKIKPHPNPAIAAADAKERHHWRYARWGLKALQTVMALLIVTTLVKYLLS